MIPSKIYERCNINIGLKTPGPGQYDMRGVSIASPEGRCTLSSYKSAAVARFSKAKRPFSAVST